MRSCLHLLLFLACWATASVFGGSTSVSPAARAPRLAVSQPTAPAPRTFWQRARTWFTGYSAPYLQVTSPKPVRLSPPPVLRQPPLLPRIVTVPIASAAPETPAAPPSAAPPEPAPTPALPTQPAPPAPEQEALQFFEQHEDLPSDRKQLGPAFDAHFLPGAVPSTSSATYHRE